VARSTCVYCGAPLAPDAVVAARGEEVPAPPAPERALVVLDLASVSPGTLEQALPVSRYEAELLARRAGLHLHRVLARAAAEAEAVRLGGRGLAVVVVSEAEVRARPLRCLGGERGPQRLDLRTEEGRVTLRRGDVSLVVRGPIVREYQTRLTRRRIETARLADGYRVHLHLPAVSPEAAVAGAFPRPLEIEAGNFEFGLAVTGSARLELEAWVEEVASGAPSDDGFRRLPPALGPAEPEVRGALSAASSLGLAARDRESGREDGPIVLDNVAQFRFYSGWRAAVERRRPARSLARSAPC
jgi:hypothetical protein